MHIEALSDAESRGGYGIQEILRKGNLFEPLIAIDQRN